MIRIALGLVLAIAALMAAGPKPHSVAASAHGYSVETVRMTYYYPTGNQDATSNWPIEGYTVGCGYDVPLWASVTLASRRVMQCRDRGNTYGPWVDFYVESPSMGWYLILTESGAYCDWTGCYATVTFSW